MVQLRVRLERRLRQRGGRARPDQQGPVPHRDQVAAGAQGLCGDAYTGAGATGRPPIETDNPLIADRPQGEATGSLLAPFERRDEGAVAVHRDAGLLLGARLDDRPAARTSRHPGVRRATGVQPTAVVTSPASSEALTNADGRPRGSESAIDMHDRPALARALDRAGVCKARSTRRVDGYKLGERLAEGPLYEDFVGTHPALNITRRVRVYPIPARRRRWNCGRRSDAQPSASSERSRTSRTRSLLKPTEFVDGDVGPSLICTTSTRRATPRSFHAPPAGHASLARRRASRPGAPGRRGAGASPTSTVAFTGR